MARRKFKKGAKCATAPKSKKIGKAMRCYCVTTTGQWKFLPSHKCGR
jgi:hypothetical protein